MNPTRSIREIVNYSTFKRDLRIFIKSLINNSS